MADLENKLRIVIVGGVAGGASAAARARRCNAQAEITVLEMGSAVSFANCGLPYHLGGEISEREKLIVATPELFWNRFRVRVRTEHRVDSIDPKAQTVTGTAHGEEFKVPYDRLILATGSCPVTPEFAQTEAQNLFQLWTLADMDAIQAQLKARPCRKAMVIGAGFVGLEVAEQLVRRKIEVSLIEKQKQVLGTLDFEMAAMVSRELQNAGVRLHLGTSVEGLLVNNKRVTAAKLSGGDTVATDLIIVGTGVRPRIELTEQAGLTLGPSGGVAINEFCQTSDPKIYAVGDIAEYHHGVSDAPVRMPLAGPANRSGRVAGAHAVGAACAPLPPVFGTSIVRAFGLTAASTGLTEAACERDGVAYRTATIQAPHHAGYFPGARSLTLKLVYGDEGKVLGAQAVGAAGVDKRIDVVASCLQFGGTVDNLASLDLCYAPPFGSAKDPLHMAAFVAQNDLRGAPLLLGADQELVDCQVVDVRNASEFEKLPPAPGAVCIPIDELHDRFEELDPDLPTVTVCHSGKRAHVAASLLQKKGFATVKNLNGGMSLRKLTERHSS